MYTNKYKESSLEDLLLGLQRKILERIKKEKLKHELTFSQIEVLRFIGLAGEKTMKSIAVCLKITPPSATEIVAELEKKGLVKRKNNKTDRRVVFVTLTERAKKHFISISKRKNIFFKKIISKLSETDHKNLKRIIKIIISEE